MKNSLLLLLTLITSIAYSQKTYTISGSIKSASNGEELIGATVYNEKTAIGTSANVYGFYSLSLPEGTYQIRYRYIGFEDLVKTISLNENQQINVCLLYTSPSPRD